MFKEESGNQMRSGMASEPSEIVGADGEDQGRAAVPAGTTAHEKFVANRCAEIMKDSSEVVNFSGRGAVNKSSPVTHRERPDAARFAPEEAPETIEELWHSSEEFVAPSGKH
jgi:predicted alpha/beta hydrolase